MKASTKRVLLLTVVIIFVSGCNDFLDQQNPNEIVATTFFQTPDQMQQAVNTLYSSASAIRGSGDGYVFTDNMRVGAVTSGTFAVDQSYFNFTTTPESSPGADFWDGLYTMIYRANTILGSMDKPDWNDNEDLKSTINAEAHFFRGLAYFHLAFLYGKVPIVTKVAESDADYNPAKAESIDAVYDQAIADLKAAKQALPETRDTPSKVARGAAGGFLGKAYLYRAGYLDEPDNYGLAATEFKEIIDSGVYGLMDTYQDNFTAVNENNKESLFELQYKYDNSLPTPTQSRWSNTVPGIASEIRYRPAEWMLQEMGREKTVNGNYDPRYLQTIYFIDGLPLFGVPYDQIGSGLKCTDGQGVGGGSSTAQGGWWRKYLNVNLDCDPSMEGKQDENNERILRYADILLMYAEAIVHSGGNTEEAVAAVRQVRQRADLPAKTYASRDELMQEIKHQRVMELTNEDTYYYDLIRWEDLGQFLMDNGTEAQAKNYDPVRNKYFPIPPYEINNNTNLEQNEAWK